MQAQNSDSYRDVASRLLCVLLPCLGWLALSELSRSGWLAVV